MYRGLFGILFVLLLVPFSGCLGSLGKKEESTPTTPTPMGTNETSLRLTVNLTRYPETANLSDAIDVSWTVSVDSNETVNLTHTAVHWANQSVPHPQTPADYGNTSGEANDVPPGSFNASFTANTTGAIYVRAHALVNGTHHWSKEATIQVSGPPTTVWTVHIGTSTVGPVSDYDPDPLTIPLGDGVKWSNEDPAGFPHSATSDTNSPSDFNTGTLEADTESQIITFDKAGTYTYHCNVHPTTMSGAQIIVEA